MTRSGVRIVPPGTSYFSRKLEADPELRKKAEAIRDQVRASLREEVEAAERSQRLTAADFAVTINATTEMMERDIERKRKAPP